MFGGATDRRLQNTCFLNDRFIARYRVNVEQRVRHRQLVQTSSDLQGGVRGSLPFVANDDHMFGAYNICI